MISAKNFRRSFIFIVLIAGVVLMPSFVAPVNAAILQPFRIGGTVTIDSVVITQATATGLTLKVTKSNGTDYTPVAQDIDGLNGANWYIIDIPIANADQPGGANPGDTAVIHVYLNGTELSVTSPVNAQLTVGASGATSQINLVAVTPPPVIINFSANPASIQPGGSSTLSWTITGATSASIDNGVGVVSATTGSSSVSPAATTTYTLTATNAGGSVTASAAVTVQATPTPTPTPTKTKPTPIKYKNCTEAKAAGVTPIRKSTDPDLYALNTALDGDKDGDACEN
jgi:hypothetical protein